jgi:hypothetical protein
MHDQAGHVLSHEQQIGAERRRQRADGDLPTHHAVAHHEVPRLVEFAIIGQMHLRHHTEQPAAMDRQRAVVQGTGMAQWRAHQQQRKQIGRRFDQIRDSLLHRVEQHGLVQQIADRVARDAEFGEHRQRRASRMARTRHIHDGCRIRGRIGERAACCAGGDPGEAVAVNRAKVFGSRHQAGRPFMSPTEYGA